MQKELHRLSKQLYQVAQVILLFWPKPFNNILLKHKENGYRTAAAPRRHGPAGGSRGSQNPKQEPMTLSSRLCIFSKGTVSSPHCPCL